jgi:hypothetical protein
MDLPVYKLMINPEVDGQSEVTAVALVDLPAIQEDFQYFNLHKQKYTIESEEQRIVSGALMIADKPIYRENDEFGAHYIVFDAATIKQIMIKYAKKGYQKNVNEMHDPAKFVDGVVLFENFQSDAKRGIKPMAGYEDLADGTWFGSMFIENEETWQKVKSGEFKGFSVEGLFIYDVPKPTDEEVLNRLQKLLELI